VLNLAANLRDLAHAIAHELAAHLPGAAAVPIDETRALCAVHGRPHAATDGRLCRPHFEEIGTWLRDIQTEAERLDPAPSTSSRLGQGGGGTLASQQTPVDLDAVVYTDPRSTAHGHRHVGPICLMCQTLAGRACTCPPLEWRRAVHYAGCPRYGVHPSCLHILADVDERAANAERLVSVVATLHTLAQRVRDERMLGTPTTHVVDRMPGVAWPGPVCEFPCTHDTCQSMAWWRDLPTPPTVASERDLLTRQLDWIATQPWVLEMRAELADLRTQLLRHNRNDDEQPLTGHCYRLVDGQECGGNLWPDEPAHTTGYDTDDDSPHRPRAVVCDRNRKQHRWERHELAMLSVVLRAQQGRELREPTKSQPAASNPTGGAGGRLAAVLEQQRREEPAS
jgi:hypothetical protein